MSKYIKIIFLILGGVLEIYGILGGFINRDLIMAPYNFIMYTGSILIGVGLIIHSKHIKQKQRQLSRALNIIAIFLFITSTISMIVIIVLTVNGINL